MAHGQFFAVLLGSLTLATPALAQRADLSTLDRSPGDRTTLVSSTEWALQAGDADLRDAPDLQLDEPGFSLAVRYAPPQHPDSLTTARGEVNWSIDDDNVLFGRVENLTKDELFADAPVHERAFKVTKLQAGYARQVPLAEDVRLTVGGSAAAFSKPDLLDNSYGNNIIGYTVFAKISLKR
jgi:hypothetical protein